MELLMFPLHVNQLTFSMVEVLRVRESGVNPCNATNTGIEVQSK